MFRPFAARSLAQNIDRLGKVYGQAMGQVRRGFFIICGVQNITAIAADRAAKIHWQIHQASIGDLNGKVLRDVGQGHAFGRLVDDKPHRAFSVMRQHIDHTTGKAVVANIRHGEQKLTPEFRNVCSDWHIFTLAIPASLASLEFRGFIGYVSGMNRILHIGTSWRLTLSTVWLVIVALTSATPAQANQGAWVAMEAGRARLVAAQIGPQNYLALELQLQAGWHTYWRYPGASGVAPVFEISARSKADRAPEFDETIFPAPHFFDDGVGGFFGYQGETGFVFPFAASDLPRALGLDAQIGICRDICIPVRLRLDVEIDAAGLADPSHQSFMRGLLDQQPKAPSSKLSIGAVGFDGERLRVRVNGENLRQPYLMIEPDSATILGPAVAVSRQPQRHIFELSAGSKAGDVFSGRALQIVARDGKHAIQQSVIVQKHDPSILYKPEDNPK